MEKFEKMISPYNRKMSNLVPCGKNEDGEQEYIGTAQEWQEAENLAEETERDESLSNQIPEEGL